MLLALSSFLQEVCKFVQIFQHYLDSDIAEKDHRFYESVDMQLIDKISSANISCLFHGGSMTHRTSDKAKIDISKLNLLGAHQLVNAGLGIHLAKNILKDAFDTEVTQKGIGLILRILKNFLIFYQEV